MNERERDAWQIGYDDALGGKDNRGVIQLMNSRWINFYDAGYAAALGDLCIVQRVLAADPVSGVEPA